MAARLAHHLEQLASRASVLGVAGLALTRAGFEARPPAIDTAARVSSPVRAAAAMARRMAPGDRTLGGTLPSWPWPPRRRRPRP